MDPAELERVTDRALRALPVPRAPRTLLPRVLKAVVEASRPWYTRAWLNWPLHWQLVSAVAAAVVVVGATAVGPAVAAGMLEVATRTSLPVSSQFAGAVSSVEAMWEASRIVWDVVAPVARLVALLLLVLSAACVAFGTALDRVIALGGAAES
jgi:hypothetical protein